MLRIWLISFFRAWDMLIDIPLPRLAAIEEFSKGEEESFRTLASFPIVGAVIGCASYCIIWLLMRFMSLSSASAISAILIVIGLEFITFGKNLTSLVSFLEAGIQKRSGKEMLIAIEEESYLSKSSIGFMFFVTIFLLRIICVGFLIYYGRASWVIITLILAYTVQSKIAVGKDIRTSRPLFETEEKAESLSWLIAGIISLVEGWSFFPAVLLALGLAYLFAVQFRMYCERKLGGVTGKIVGLAGTAAETLLFLAGVILLCHDR